MPIRDAIVGDAEVCAPLIYNSAAQKYDYGIGAFGDNPIAIIESAFRHYAYDFHKVVESEGKVIGVAAYHTNQDARKVALKALHWAMCHYRLLQLSKLILRLRKLTQMQAPTDDDTLYITNIAVVPERRGQGIMRSY